MAASQSDVSLIQDLCSISSFNSLEIQQSRYLFIKCKDVKAAC